MTFGIFEATVLDIKLINPKKLMFSDTLTMRPYLVKLVFAFKISVRNTYRYMKKCSNLANFAHGKVEVCNMLTTSSSQILLDRIGYFSISSLKNYFQVILRSIILLRTAQQQQPNSFSSSLSTIVTADGF